MSTFFVVERTPTGEQAALYYDFIPPRLLGINAARNGLIYIVRMDTLPNAATWTKMSLGELYEAYCKARDRGTLPAGYTEPRLAPNEKPKRLLGERRQRPPRPWAHIPAEPFPTVAELDKRSQEAAFRRATEG